MNKTSRKHGRDARQQVKSTTAKVGVGVRKVTKVTEMTDAERQRATALQRRRRSWAHMSPERRYYYIDAMRELDRANGDPLTPWDYKP